MVCIVENWLDANIADHEIGIQGYQVYCRLDKKRHVGDVLTYVRDNFVTHLYPSPDNLELLTFSVCSNVNKVYISLFYRPPNSPVEIFEYLFLYLQSLNSSLFCNYILIGDFNVNFCNENHSLVPLVLNRLSLNLHMFALMDLPL